MRYNAQPAEAAHIFQISLGTSLPPLKLASTSCGFRGSWCIHDSHRFWRVLPPLSLLFIVPVVKNASKTWCHTVYVLTSRFTFSGHIRAAQVPFLSKSYAVLLFCHHCCLLTSLKVLALTLFYDISANRIQLSNTLLGWRIWPQEVWINSLV